MKTMKLFFSFLLMLALLSGMIGGAISASAEGGIYRHWDAETGTLTFNDDPAGGTWVAALNYGTLLGGVAKRADVKKIVFACDIPVNDGCLLFSECSNLTAIEGLDRLDTSNATDMSCMFDGCSGLTELDVSGFDTSKVKNMWGMFGGCSGLTELDVSGFDTANVIDMANMFAICSGLTELDLSGFNTANVTNMGNMFDFCGGLSLLDISGFDTSKVTDMGAMFQKCSSLTSLDISSFDTSNVESMSYMFAYCSSLTSLDVSGFDTSNVTNMRFMFGACSGLTELDISGFDTSNVTDMRYMFSGCSGLKVLKVGANFGAACPQGNKAAFPVRMLEQSSRKGMSEGVAFPKDAENERTYLTVFSVQYEPNSGIGKMAGTPVAYDEKLTLPECSFTAPEGKEFDRWDLGAPGEQVEITENTTVKAIWKDTVVEAEAETAAETEAVEETVDAPASAESSAGVSGVVIGLAAVALGAVVVAAILIGKKRCGN